jgi:hypothetical protein
MYLQSHIYKNIPVSFDFITTRSQGMFLCSPCTVSSFVVITTVTCTQQSTSAQGLFAYPVA